MGERGARGKSRKDAFDDTLAVVRSGDATSPSAGAVRLDVGPGQRVGRDDRFEITGELGAGAMGLVFSAIDHQLERSVAIKFILPDAGVPLDRLAALLTKEAKATAKLNHKNIVGLFDIDTWKDVPFLVMEHLEGEPLSALIAAEPLGVARALEIMIGVTAGLAHAHSFGIIHRDLKPKNIFILEDGAAKILDFGLAKIIGSEREKRNAEIAKHPGSGPMTIFGVGTPGYMAPEQWRPDVHDHRTDIWAAGVTLFQLIAGELPYDADDLIHLRRELLSEEPAPRLKSFVEVPEQLDTIVARAMSKAPEKRYQSADELRRALVEFQRVHRASARSGRDTRRASERRQLTFVSCALANTTPLHDDPDEVGDLSTFHRACADVFSETGGRPISSVGALALGCFGYPVAGEDDARNAVAAALRIALRLKREVQAGGAGFEVRIGVHTGTVIVEETVVEPSTPTFHGNAPHVAASLADRGEPGSVMVSQATYVLIKGRFATAAHGAVPLEGTSQPVAAHVVLHEISAASRFEQRAESPTPFIGRTKKVGHLLSLWDRAAAGERQYVMLSGEAGIGKSRLVELLKDKVGSQDNIRMTCQCWPQFQYSAFYPVIELLYRSMGIAREDAAADKLRKLETALSGLGFELPASVPIFGALLSVPFADRYAPLGLASAQQRKLTIQALATMLIRMTERAPTLFVVEDLHWTDHSTLEFLGHLLEQAPSARLLVLLTYRPEFHAPWSERPGLNPIPLDRLSDASSALLIRSAAGDVALPDDLVDQLVTKSDGIPLFCEEITRMVVHAMAGKEVTGTAVAAAVPATLSELLRARLDTLSTAGRDVAQYAAIIGRTFSYELLRTIFPLDEQTLSQGLAELVEAGLVRTRGDAAEAKYIFKHALVQEAAYQSVVKKERQQHHLRVAQTLVEQFADLVERQPELTAHHYTEAGQVTQAIDYWERAGKRAVERSANVEGIDNFMKALRLLATLPEGPERNAREIGLQLAAGGPLMAVKGYAAPEVEKAYGRAHELCLQAGINAQLFPALQGLWQFYMVGGQLPKSREIGSRLLELATASGDVIQLMMARRAIATTVFLMGEPAACREHTSAGRALYDIQKHGTLGQKFGHDPGVAHCCYLGWSSWLLGAPDQALEAVRAGQALARELAHPTSVAFSTSMLAMVLNYRGEHEEALREAQAAKVICDEYKLALWLSWATMMIGWAEAGMGDYESGIRDLRQGVVLWQQTGARAGLTYFPIVLAEALCDAGRLADATEVLDGAAPVVDKNGEYFYLAEMERVRGLVDAAAGAVANAEAHFRRAVQIAREQQAGGFELRAALALARLARGGEGAGEARKLLGEVYEKIIEGRGTRDLVKARELLDEA